MRSNTSSSREGAPTTCRGCGTRHKIVPILYGEHGPQAEELSRQGRVVLAVPAGYDRPRWECLVCGTRSR